MGCEVCRIRAVLYGIPYSNMVAFKRVYVYCKDYDLHSFVCFDTLYTDILEVIERPGERPRTRVMI